jgi:hypothetical protein
MQKTRLSSEVLQISMHLMMSISTGSAPLKKCIGAPDNECLKQYKQLYITSISFLRINKNRNCICPIELRGLAYKEFE